MIFGNKRQYFMKLRRTNKNVPIFWAVLYALAEYGKMLKSTLDPSKTGFIYFSHVSPVLFGVIAISATAPAPFYSQAWSQTSRSVEVPVSVGRADVVAPLPVQLTATRQTLRYRHAASGASSAAFDDSKRANWQKRPPAFHGVVSFSSTKTETKTSGFPTWK